MLPWDCTCVSSHFNARLSVFSLSSVSFPIDALNIHRNAEEKMRERVKEGREEERKSWKREKDWKEEM